LEQSFQFINEISPREFLRSPIEITFEGEEGIDSGGLYREWYSILTRSIFSPNYMLFSLASDGVTYQLNSQSGVNPEHLKYFRFIGRLIAKAICDNQLMDVHFTKPFYKHMLGLPISFSDLAVLDPAYHQSLSALLACPLADLGMDGPLHSLSFSVDQNVFGMEECEDLIPNGRNVLVTDENKHEYVRLLAQHRLTASSKLQLDSFLEGFRELLPASCLQFFDPSELELLISGLPEIDIEDLIRNTTYTGYTAKDTTICYLWNVLRSFTAEEKALFLQFVTGTCKVPLEGFCSLQGSEGVQKFGVHKAYNKTQLPMAHTCFNQLDLPEYDSEEILREKLLIAIREGSEGFGMA